MRDPLKERRSALLDAWIKRVYHRHPVYFYLLVIAASAITAGLCILIEYTLEVLGW